MTAIATSPGATLQRIASDRDAAMRASFDKIVPPDKVVGEPANPAAPYQNATDGKATPEQAAPEAGDKQPDKPATPAIPDAELASIRTRLNLDGIDNETIDHLAEWNPEKLRALSAKAKERHKAADKVKRDEAEARKREAPQTPTKPAEPVADLAADLAALDEAMAAELSTDGRKALKAVHKGILDKLSALERQQSHGTSLANYATQRLENIEESQWRAANRERFPQLDDDEHWEALREDAKKQARRGDATSVGDVLGQSARILFADAMHQDQASRKAALDRKRDAGQLDSPNSPRTPQTVEVTPDRLSRLMFDAIQDKKLPEGCTREQAMKILGVKLKK